jgi:hypothetical protein
MTAIAIEAVRHSVEFVSARGPYLHLIATFRARCRGSEA